MCPIATRLDAAAITLLVAEPGAHFNAAAMIPIDLAERSEAVDDLKQIAADNHLQVSDLIVVGLEFGHPEQFGTTVTVTGVDACSAIFADATGTKILLEDVALQVTALATVTIPINDLSNQECTCNV